MDLQLSDYLSETCPKGKIFVGGPFIFILGDEDGFRYPVQPYPAQNIIGQFFHDNFFPLVHLQ